MIPIVASHIRQKPKGYYLVRLMDEKKPKAFKSFDKAFEFVKKNMINLLNTDEISSVALQYERFDKRASYVIWEKTIDSDDVTHIIEFEESAYDFVETHDLFFPKNITNKMINESYYSFHDFARVKVLSSDRMSKLGFFSYIVITILAFLSFFFGMHATNLTAESNDTFNLSEKVRLSVAISFTTVLMIVGIASAVLFSRVPVYWLRKKSDSIEEINWRKINVQRNILSIITISLNLLVIISSGYIFNELSVEDVFDNPHTELYAFGITFVFAFLASISVAIAISLIALINFLYFRKNVYKYFEEQEVEELRKWLKFKPAKVAYKTDKNYFILPHADTYEVAARRREDYIQMRNSITYDELKEYKYRALRHYDNSVVKYYGSPEFNKLQEEYNGYFL